VTKVHKVVQEAQVPKELKDQQEILVVMVQQVLKVIREHKVIPELRAELQVLKVIQVLREIREVRVNPEVRDQTEHKVVLVLQDLKEPKEIKVLREVLVITDLRVLLVQLEVKVTMGMVHKGHQDLLHPQTIQEQQVLKEPQGL
jgi:hypothetical protein